MTADGEVGVVVCDVPHLGSQRLPSFLRARLPVALLALVALLAYKRRLWLRVQLHVWRIQIQALGAEGAADAGLGNWLVFQKHVWQLLQLEAARRLEEDVVGKANLAPGVPHVDTGSGVSGTSAAPAAPGSAAAAPASAGQMVRRPTAHHWL
jgi:hypothetical protein